MPEDKYIVLSMQDKKSEDIAKVISNKTARQILEALTDKSLSPNKLSKKLDIPLSTVEYNLDQLIKVNLIRIKNTKFSVKGRKVNYYEPAKKLILIAPEETSKGLLQTLLNSAVLPVVMIVIGGFGLFIRFVNEVSFRSALDLSETKTAAGMVANIELASHLIILKFIFLIIIIIGIILLVIRKRR